MHELKIAAIGGGTGLSTMLRGLKIHTNRITAIVSVADDGGSSGVLRSDMGMLPPGDIRNCIAALTGVDPIYDELLNYRFKSGTFDGHTVGNILLAAINDMSESFEEAVSILGRMVGIYGKVVPVTNANVTLSALLNDGTVINGESNIGHRTNTDIGIDRVFMTPNDAEPSETAINALHEADVIVLGPGSLYTSVIPNLLVNGITDAIRESKAKTVYVCNIMTQPGETDGYTASDHLAALEEHSFEGIADYIIVNDMPVPESVKQTYAAENAEQVRADMENIENRVGIMHGHLWLVKNGQVRHNFSRLARGIVALGDIR